MTLEFIRQKDLTVCICVSTVIVSSVTRETIISHDTHAYNEIVCPVNNHIEYVIHISKFIQYKFVFPIAI